LPIYQGVQATGFIQLHHLAEHDNGDSDLRNFAVGDKC
jgi:hypothetical protein